jgi:release factor glutamine methyltransferase
MNHCSTFLVTIILHGFFPCYECFIRHGGFRPEANLTTSNVGTQPFGPYELRVRAPVLIPRPETEEWTLRLHELITPTVTTRLDSGDNFRILDLCTGSGCIPLLLLGLLPKQSKGLAVDISTEALALAKENAVICGISPERLTLLEANIKDTAFIQKVLSHGPFHLLTANPPYIAPAEYVTLPRSVRDFEDARALVSVMNATSHDDPRGISFYDRIAELISVKDVLVPGSLVALEIGSNQGRDVAEIMRDRGRLQDVKVWKDAWGKDRVVLGRSA